jgi:excinuclease ABC subunit A
VIDLGPGAGDEGGKIVAQGTPEEIAVCPESHTGRALAEVLSVQYSVFREDKRPGPLKTEY